MTYLAGLDVSKWQGEQDYRGLEGVAFVCAKATDGEAGVDSMWSRNRTAIRAAGISLGAYHWYKPSQCPMKQARHFVETVGPLNADDFGLAIDVEEAGGRKGQDILDGLVEHVREVIRLTGRRPLIYSANWFWSQHIGLDSPELSACPLWVAQYPSTRPDSRPFDVAANALASEPTIPMPWAKRGMVETVWQFDGDGGLRLPDGTDVDANRMRGPSVARFAKATRADSNWTPRHIDDVACMQRALTLTGYPLGNCDGIAGPKTRAAMAAFARDYGLETYEIHDAIEKQYVTRVFRTMVDNLV